MVVAAKLDGAVAVVRLTAVMMAVRNVRVRVCRRIKDRGLQDRELQDMRGVLSCQEHSKGQCRNVYPESFFRHTNDKNVIVICITTMAVIDVYENLRLCPVRHYMLSLIHI